MGLFPHNYISFSTFTYCLTLQILIFTLFQIKKILAIKEKHTQKNTNYVKPSPEKILNYKKINVFYSIKI